MKIANRVFFLTVLCVSSICFGNGELSSDEETEVRESCCTYGESFAMTVPSAERCAGAALPDDIEPEQEETCRRALVDCCEKQIKQKKDCDAGIAYGPAKRCSVPKTAIGKTCCEECQFGILSGETLGKEACGDPPSDEDSPNTQLRKKASYQCCLTAANKPETTTKKVTTTTKKPTTTTSTTPKPKEKCKQDSCQHLCNDDEGKITCACFEGYRLKADKKTCKDINECAEALEDLCIAESTVCHNTPGSFKCVPLKKRDVSLSCPPGFKRNVENQVCDDINECQLPKPPCPKYLCENTIGAYKCGGKLGKPFEEAVPGVTPTPAPINTPPKNDMCPPGFRAGPDDECIDIDECEEHLDDCQRLSQYCINTHGLFFCQDHVSKRCTPGFKVNRVTGICEDIDECEESSEMCKRTEICVNLPGAYICKSKLSSLPKLARPGVLNCQEGTRMKPGGTACEDIDECREGTHLCDGFQNCINTYGGHECRCKNGFELNSSGACEDIDECALKLDNCGGGTYCVNNRGSFSCQRMSSTTSTHVPDDYEYYYSDEDSTDTSPPTRSQHPASKPRPTSNTSTSTTTTPPPTTPSTTTPRTTTPRATPTPAPWPPRPSTPRRTSSVTTSTTIPPTPPLPPRPPMFDPYGVYPDNNPYISRSTPRPYTNIPPVEADTRRSDSTRPDYGVTETSTPESRRPDSSRPEWSRPDSSRPDSSRSDSNRPDWSRPDWSRPDSNRPNSNRPDSNRPDSNRPDLNRPDSNRPDSNRPDSNRPDSNRPDSNRPDSNRPDSNRPDSRRPDPTRPYWSRPESNKPEQSRPQSRPEVPDTPRRPSYERPTEVPLIVPDKPATIDTERGPDGSYDIDTSAVPKDRWTTVNVYDKRKPDEDSETELHCLEGFQRKLNGVCVDIDECAENRYTCSEFEECVNRERGYTCECVRGYSRDNSGLCRDTRVRITTTERNRPVYYPNNPHNGPRYSPRPRDKCDELGYEYDNTQRRCVDIDECAKNIARCTPKEDCVNTDGGYHCVCGARCHTETIDPLPPPAYPNPLTNMITTGAQYGQRGPRQVRPVYTRHYSSPTAIAKCPWGYKLSDEMCLDIDECARNTSECGSQQRCDNFYGGYSCNCPPGHKLVGQTRCEDIDECSYGQPCSHNARCINTVGAYRCACNEGFENAPSNEKVCMDIDECLTPGICDHSCSNTWGSYRCYCKKGYRLAGNRTCEDINECEEYSSSRYRGKLCEGICVNQPGSYRCSCPAGYRLSGDGWSCIDIDECENGEATCARGGPGEVCKNTNGGYHCHHIDCPRGYRLDSKQRCTRIQRSCQVNDFDCIKQPSTYSYNFITIVANVYLPTGSVDLFTMHGPAWTDTQLQFDLRTISVDAGQAVQPSHSHCFQMYPAANSCRIALLCSLEGPQVIEMELTMELSRQGMVAGSAAARLIVIVSEYEY